MSIVAVVVTALLVLFSLGFILRPRPIVLHSDNFIHIAELKLKSQQIVVNKLEVIRKKGWVIDAILSLLPVGTGQNFIGIREYTKRNSEPVMQLRVGRNEYSLEDLKGIEVSNNDWLYFVSDEDGATYKISKKHTSVTETPTIVQGESGEGSAAIVLKIGNQSVCAIDKLPPINASFVANKMRKWAEENTNVGRWDGLPWSHEVESHQ